MARSTADVRAGKRGRWRVVGVLLVVALALLPVSAQGQSTGSSFGGGSWGSEDSDHSWSGSSGSSGGSSGGGDSWGSSSRSSSWSDSWETSASDDWPSSDADESWNTRESAGHDARWDAEEDWDESPRSGGGCSAGEWACTFGGVLLLLLFFGKELLLEGLFAAASIGGQPRWNAPPRGPLAKTFGVDVTALMVGLRSDARRRIQKHLEGLARRANLSSPEGRREALGAVARALLGEREAWVYLGAHDGTPGRKSARQRDFRAIVQDLRSRFRHEILRATDTRSQMSEGPTSRAKPEEGEGLCVVSIVVAARRDLRDLAALADPAQMAAALRTVTELSIDELIAFEVIWSPATETDRMSSAELELLYPEMKSRSGDAVGPVRCAACGARFARELGSCPSCGAPIEGRASRRGGRREADRW